MGYEFTIHGSGAMFQFRSCSFLLLEVKHGYAYVPDVKAAATVYVTVWILVERSERALRLNRLKKPMCQQSLLAVSMVFSAVEAENSRSSIVAMNVASLPS